MTLVPGFESRRIKKTYVENLRRPTDIKVHHISFSVFVLSANDLDLVATEEPACDITHMKGDASVLPKRLLGLRLLNPLLIVLEWRFGEGDEGVLGVEVDDTAKYPSIFGARNHADALVVGKWEERWVQGGAS